MIKVYLYFGLGESLENLQWSVKIEMVAVLLSVSI